MGFHNFDKLFYIVIYFMQTFEFITARKAYNRGIGGW